MPHDREATRHDLEATRTAMTNRRGHDASLILVRHGETVGESSIRYHGRNDVALSDPGRAQMGRVRDALKSLRGSLDFARVFSSPLVRAAEGARIIARDSAPIFTVEEFAEVHFGLFEGLTADEIRNQFPEEFARWNIDRLAPAYTYPEGESRAAFAERVEHGIEKMFAVWAPRSATDGEAALLVAHRGVIRAIVRKLTGAEPIVELGSIQFLRFDDRWQTGALDLTEHLAGL